MAWSPLKNLFLGYPAACCITGGAESMLVLSPARPLCPFCPLEEDEDEAEEGEEAPLCAAACSMGLATPFSSKGGVMDPLRWPAPPPRCGPVTLCCCCCCCAANAAAYSAWTAAAAAAAAAAASFETSPLTPPRERRSSCEGP